MSKFTDAQLVALHRRCVTAVARGYTIAQAGQFINQLADETGVKDVPAGVQKGSAAHLLALVNEAKDQRAGKKAKPKPAPAPKPPPPSEPGDEEAPYENWTKKELYDLAVERDIDGRSGMDKDELIVALEEWDEEHGE
jgi:hypothetical protein